MFAAVIAKGAIANSSKPRANRTFEVFAAACLGLLVALPARADSLTMGSLSNYALVALGNGKTIGQNSGPVAGNELLGNGITAGFAGGNNGQITGTLYYDNTVQGTNTFSKLDTPPTVSQVLTTVTQQALSDAIALSNAASGLTPTQTFATINSTTTITGNGGVNVISVGSIQNAPITFSGSANDYFVINLSGTLNTNVAMTLGTNVSASHILWNLTGTSGDIFKTAGGNKVYGTFLSTKGGDFQFSNLDLNGELINTAGNVQFVSGSALNTFSPFTGTPQGEATPLPGTLAASSALFGLVLIGRLRRRHAA